MLSEAEVTTRTDFPYIQIVIADKILGQYGKWAAIDIPLLIMRGLTHLQSRARALDQGHKHFYFDAFLQVLTFIDTTLVSDKLKKNIASAFIYQIAVEKHCLWALSRSDNSIQYYWFAKLKEAYSILSIRKSLAFYIEGIPLMLAPAFLGNIYYFLRFILVADLLSAAKRRSNHGEMFLWLIYKLYKSCVKLIGQLAPPRGV